MRRVYIVHGYGGTPEKHWFPWLAAKLCENNIECHRLTMPDTDNPNPDKWLNALIAQVQLDDQAILIGHSLGCIAILNFLAKTRQAPKRCIFVSGFYQPLPNLPELTGFTNVYTILPDVPSCDYHVIAALDDDVVPHTYSDALAVHLNAVYHRFPNGGHFLGEEGVTELPQVLDLILKGE